jgi:hypothetical protein
MIDWDAKDKAAAEKDAHVELNKVCPLPAWARDDDDWKRWV